MNIKNKIKFPVLLNYKILYNIFMASKKTKEKQKSIKTIKEKWHHGLKDETKNSIFAVAFFVLGMLFSLAAFGKAGAVGNSAYKILEALFGTGFFILPVMFFMATISFFSSSLRPNFLSHTIIGGIMFIASGLGLMDIIVAEKTGGWLGYIISWPLLKLFDFWISLLIIIAFFIISILIMFNISISLNKLGFPWKKEKEDEKNNAEVKKEKEDETQQKEGKKETLKESILATSLFKKTKPETEKMAQAPRLLKFEPFPLELLEGDKGKPSSGDIKANANIIKRTLQNFGIEVEMDEISIGPSVTQYTLKPAEGVKLSRIVALQNDLSLALAAYPLRIEAPIPGKSLVGVEIPNTVKTIVGLATLLSDEFYKKSGYPLLIAMGRDVTGKAIFSNLSKMPHVLVAGATGTGKSIFIHSLIISLLQKNSPESLRFLMIDPKRVELTIYNKIPHILAPVITDAKKAILTLKWACQEMERRYEELLKAGVRDIISYHEKHEGYNSMPYLIIIIDELADLMATYPREMEASVVRLAQMSRAVGIHLVVSTQRPSVEVITGLIKANITSRVAMQVASQVDSRTILDMAGADKLLGNGDMLYLAGDTGKPKRIQGPFISEKEVKKVVKHLENQYEKENFEELNITDNKKTDNGVSQGMNILNLNFEGMEDNSNEDELYEEVKNLVIKTGKASASYLQRRFSIGYARAARLLDILEERGIIGPADGAKAREVFVKENKESQTEDYDV